MKKLIKNIKDLFKKQKVSLDPNTIEGKVLTTLNTIIQSPAIQGMEFKVSSKCDKTSVINDIEFCDEVYVHDSYAEQELNADLVFISRQHDNWQAFTKRILIQKVDIEFKYNDYKYLTCGNEHDGTCWQKIVYRGNEDLLTQWQKQ